MIATIRAYDNKRSVQFDILPLLLEASDNQIRELMHNNLEWPPCKHLPLNPLTEYDYPRVKEVIDYCEDIDDGYDIVVDDRDSFYDYIITQRPYLQHPRRLIDVVVSESAESDRYNILTSLMATVFLDSDCTTGEHLIKDKTLDDDDIQKIKDTLARLVKEERMFME